MHICISACSRSLQDALYIGGVKHSHTTMEVEPVPRIPALFIIFPAYIYILWIFLTQVYMESASRLLQSFKVRGTLFPVELWYRCEHRKENTPSTTIISVYSWCKADDCQPWSQHGQGGCVGVCVLVFIFAGCLFTALPVCMREKLWR